MSPRLFASLLLATSHAACSGGDGPLFTAASELEEARARWEAGGIEDYTFRLSYVCGECLHYGTTEIVVRDGAVQSIEWVTPPPDENVFPFAMSVDELFGFLSDRLAERPWRVDLAFAAEGYPVRASFDSAEDYVDDEFGFSISAFHPD